MPSPRNARRSLPKDSIGTVGRKPGGPPFLTRLQLPTAPREINPIFLRLCQSTPFDERIQNLLSEVRKVHFCKMSGPESVALSQNAYGSVKNRAGNRRPRQAPDLDERRRVPVLNSRFSSTRGSFMAVGDAPRACARPSGGRESGQKVSLFGRTRKSLPLAKPAVLPKSEANFIIK